MNPVSRREWAELRFAHPGVDLANPSDDFATALLTLAGLDPDVWVHGGEQDAIDAYRLALSAARPDITWALEAIDADADLAVEVTVCNDLGISHDEFLTWPARSQDLAIAAALRKANTCSNGHPREAMNDASLVTVARAYCAVCAAVEELNEKFRDLPVEYHRGFTTEVTRVPR